MSDLISRSALLEIIEKMNFDFGNDSDDTETIIEMVSEAVNNQPTAYDVDKVVEQVEEKTEFLKEHKKYETLMMYEIVGMIEDLIDIIRKGGVE